MDEGPDIKCPEIHGAWKRIAAQMPRLRNTELDLYVRTCIDFQHILLGENGKLQNAMYIIPLMQIKQKAEWHSVISMDTCICM